MSIPGVVGCIEQVTDKEVKVNREKKRRKNKKEEEGTRKVYGMLRHGTVDTLGVGDEQWRCCASQDRRGTQLYMILHWRPPQPASHFVTAWRPQPRFLGILRKVMRFWKKISH